MAEQVEKASNQMAQKGYELVTFSTMPSTKGILVFKENGTANNNAADNAVDAQIAILAKTKLLFLRHSAEIRS